MIFNKGQITVVEAAFIFMLMVGAIGYFVAKPLNSSLSYQKNIDSLADAIYYSENFRILFMDEDLSILSKSGDWSSFENFLNSSVFEYDLLIGNFTYNKTIYSCEGDFKEFAERVISIRDNDYVDFRYFRLGVCY